jgi:hypothetical protein
MRALRWVAVILVVYVALVVVFESGIGYFQPGEERSLVLTTFDEEDGTGSARVLAPIESEGQLFVAANHWPRAWYNRALENPDVEVKMGGEEGGYRAAEVTDEELARLQREHGLPVVVRVLTGFPPRRFLRLDPV